MRQPRGGTYMASTANTAQSLLLEALLTRLRRQDKEAAKLEQSAHDCADYTPEMCVSYLLAAAKRHAQYGDTTRMNEMLASAEAHAAGNLRAQLHLLIGTGSVLAWLGRLNESCVRLMVASVLATPLACAGIPGYFSLWTAATKELGFVLRLLQENNSGI